MARLLFLSFERGPKDELNYRGDWKSDNTRIYLQFIRGRTIGEIEISERLEFRFIIFIPAFPRAWGELGSNKESR